MKSRAKINDKIPTCLVVLHIVYGSNEASADVGRWIRPEILGGKFAPFYLIKQAISLFIFA